ncbi:Oxidoreductase, aldo/keto reductase family [Fulvivirga imtechensis AK7]|uniref:Oxidoreductase, aldo/keto reductase family n=1 Tax=Fulvivirga imtechensis AK7 TaxID=1237149 RepID=L8JLR4_9BACT|nr:aldo/keto reductase [Fulvivirga imtechensis]ELR69871.1 Oxidoreductase, aldo/keto reductase family [Fulvivirga imtechensis AK7]
MMLKSISGSPLKLTPIVLGKWHIHELSKRELETLINAALEVGITSFDHADIYGGYTCEEAFGNWLATNSDQRDGIRLISKCGIRLVNEQRPDHRVKHYDTSEAHIIASAERSLKNLKTDYLDLLLIHRPDPLMNPEEVASAFSKLKEDGKVLNFGVSNFTTSQFSLLSKYSDEPVITNQVELSIFRSEAMFDGSLDYMMERGINPMAWSPVGGRKNIGLALKNDEVLKMAAKYNLEVGNLLLAWLLKHPAGIVPVIGTMNPERVRSSVTALQVDFDRQDWFHLLKVIRTYDVP